jgi:transcriptional regulator with XRE-family HTH domain
MNQSSPRTLGAFIHQRREFEGKSLRALARELGTSRSLLSEIENEKRFPSERLLQMLAKRFHVEREELKKFDTRVHLSELRHHIAACPQFGSAMKRMILAMNNGEAAPEHFADVIWKALEAEKAFGAREP